VWKGVWMSVVRLSYSLRHIIHTYRTPAMDFSKLWKNCYRFTHVFFKRCKTTCLSSVSSHCLVKLPAKMSALNSHMQQNAFYRYLKWTFEDLLPCYCEAIKINKRQIRSHVSQPTSAWKKANMSELKAHHCMTPG